MLFASSEAKEVSIADLREHREGGGVWNFNFSRNFNDWENFVRFLSQLQGHSVNREQEGGMDLNDRSKGRFSKALYSLLESDCFSLFLRRDYLETLDSV